MTTMPVNLYLKIVNVFLGYYKNRKLSSDLCSDIIVALGPICEKIEKGEYDMKGKNNARHNNVL